MEHDHLSRAGEEPIACRLVGQAFAERKEAITRELFAHAEAVEALPDGVAVRFPAGEPWPERALAFIAAERQCCPFFTFELRFEPHGGPLWLRLRGPDGTDAFIASELGLAPELPAEAP